MLVPGNVTGADPGTLQRSSGLKFRLGPDCSRLEETCGECLCPTCLALQTPSALSNLAEKTSALASDDSKLTCIVDIDVLSSGWE